MANINGCPASDGEITYFKLPAALAHAAHTSDMLIYVNGMNTEGEEHRRVAMVFSRETRHDLFGIYNMKGSPLTYNIARVMTAMKLVLDKAQVPDFVKAVVRQVLGPSVFQINTIDALIAFLTDLEQCAEDWVKKAEFEAIRLAFAGMKLYGNVSAAARIFDIVTSDAIKHRHVRVVVAHAILSGNPATLALFNLLEQDARKGKAIRIICHSQGNLIVANALSLLKWVCRGRFDGPVKVWALASPVPPRSWPLGPGLDLQLFTNAADPVTWLSLDESYQSAPANFKRSVVFREGSGMGAHDVNLYNRQHDFMISLSREFQVPKWGAVQTAGRAAAG